MQITWNWLKAGLLLGSIFLLAVLLVKPLGVSTQFVIFDGILWDSVSQDLVIEDPESKSGYSSDNAYLNKSGGKYAKSIEEPINYSFILVISMILGGFLSHYLQKNKLSDSEKEAPEVFREAGKHNRAMYAFAGGVLVLFGARLAGGCTSGHMMSGMMQTSLSGYLFALGAFAAGIPLALVLYKSKRQEAN